MYETDGPVDGWKSELSAFDHPRGELGDLFCGQSLLLDQPTNHRIADPECSGGLLHRDPETLFRRRTRRKPRRR